MMLKCLKILSTYSKITFSIRINLISSPGRIIIFSRLGGNLINPKFNFLSPFPLVATTTIFNALFLKFGNGCWKSISCGDKIGKILSLKYSSTYFFSSEVNSSKVSSLIPYFSNFSQTLL